MCSQTVAPRNFSKRILSDVRKFQSWVSGPQYKETRPIQEIPPQELDRYMASFLRGVKTRHGDNYDPNSLHSLRCNIDRYLKDCSYPYSLTKSVEFYQSQAVMKSQRRQLIEDISLSHSELALLKEHNLLARDTPLALIKSVFAMMSLHFGTYLKSRTEHCNLYWGDLDIDEDTSEEGFLVLAGTMSKAVGSSRLTKALGQRIVRVPADMKYPNCCPVRLYREYKKRRSADNLAPDTRFYQRPGVFGDPGVWFSSSLPVNNQFLGQIVRELKASIQECEIRTKEDGLSG